MKEKIKFLLNKYDNMPVQARAGFWFLVCTVVQRSVTVITTPIFTRLLTEDEYGEYGVFISWMGILSCFVTMFIFSGIYPQAIVKYSEKKNEISSGMQGITIVLVLFWCAVYYLGRNFWNDIFSLNTSELLAMFIIMWGNAVFGFWSTEKRIAYKYRELLIVTVIETILQPLLSVLLLLNFDDKVAGLVWGIALANIICYCPLFIIQMMRGKVFYSGDIWKYSLRLAVPLIPHYLSSVVLNSADRIMIQKMVGDGPAGIYNLAYTISICGTLINQAVLQTIQPWVYTKIKEEKYDEIKKVAYPSLIAIGFVNLVIILISPELIRIFAPPAYYDAVWVMPPISISVFFMFMFNLFAYFEFYYEKPGYVSIATFSGAALNIVLNYFFIRQFGYMAAGYTTLICYFAFCVAHYFFMRIILKERGISTRIYSVRWLTVISAIVIALGFAIMITYNHILIRYGVLLILVIACLIKRKAIVEFFKGIIKAK